MASWLEQAKAAAKLPVKVGIVSHRSAVVTSAMHPLTPNVHALQDPVPEDFEISQEATPVHISEVVKALGLQPEEVGCADTL
jgi:hypothetical protein